MSLFALLSNSLSAQITDADAQKALRTQSTDTIFGWTVSGLVSINAANTMLVNWIAGGNNTLGFESTGSIFANVRTKRFVWENNLNAALGTMRQGNTHRDKFLKTNDRLQFNSKYGQRAYRNFFYSALVNAQTQMLIGKNYSNDTTYTIISRFWAPAQILTAIGMDYNPNANLSVFVSPISARMTFVHDQTLANAGAFGVTPAIIDPATGAIITPGQRSLCQYGGYVSISYKKNSWRWELLKNVMYITNLNLFSNYVENPQNIKVDWSNQLLFKVNKYITFMFSNQFLYDDVVKVKDTNGDGVFDATGGQYKQITSLGFAFNF